MILARLRVVAGVAILAGLVLFGVLLVPSYWRNHEFEQSLEQLPAAALATDDSARSAVLEKAAAFQLPVQPGDVRVRRSRREVRVEVRYRVPVTVSLYTVDLHFRPETRRAIAGMRE